jgi:hypothetical protein
VLQHRKPNKIVGKLQSKPGFFQADGCTIGKDVGGFTHRLRFRLRRQLQGDLSSQQMYLRIADQRARLLGLYPKEPQVHLKYWR